MWKKFDIEGEYLLFILSLVLIVGLIGYYSYKHSDAYLYSTPQKSVTTNRAGNNSASTSKSANSSSFTFKGNKTQIIELKEGLNEFNITYNGNSTFNSAILYGDGVLLDSLANSRGSYKGVSGIVTPGPHTYLLSVQCGDDGEWTISRR